MTQPVRPRRRGVLGGLVVIAVGVPFILQAQGVPNASSYLFVALGLAFMAAYVRGNRNYVYLVPGAALTSFGIALLLPTWIRLPAAAVTPAFLAALASGLAVAVALEPSRKWPLVPAGLLAAVAAADFIGGVSVIPAAIQPHFVPIVVMSIGVYLLVEPNG